jgi:hypothetical protein
LCWFRVFTSFGWERGQSFTGFSDVWTLSWTATAATTTTAAVQRRVSFSSALPFVVSQSVGRFVDPLWAVSRLVGLRVGVVEQTTKGRDGRALRTSLCGLARAIRPRCAVSDVWQSLYEAVLVERAQRKVWSTV